MVVYLKVFREVVLRCTHRRFSNSQSCFCFKLPRNQTSQLQSIKILPKVMKYTFLKIFIAIISIKLTNGIDILSILKHFRVSFDDNLLTIKPLPNIEHQIEIQNGYLNGVKNGTVPRNTITGFHYTEIITTDNINTVTNQRTIKFETVTCTGWFF